MQVLAIQILFFRLSRKSWEISTRFRKLLNAEALQFSVFVSRRLSPDLEFKMIMKVPFTRLLPRNKGETLFSPFLVSTVVKLFICFAGSYSRLLMADITLLLYITGWAALYIFRNLPYDEYFKENNLPRFPYKADNVGNWFQRQVSSDGNETRTINMLNLSEKPRPPNSNYPLQNEAVFAPREEDMEDFTMLYHGTAHEFAKSIIDEINMSKSRVDADFSCGKGFYVTKNFESAKEKYGFKKFPKPAVLAFKIPNPVLESFRELSLDLMGEGKKDDWKEVTKNIRKESKKYNFIEGPEMKRELGGAKTYEQLPGTHQMCILKEEMAEAFDIHLHSVVFYNTSKSGRKRKKP